MAERRRSRTWLWQCVVALALIGVLVALLYPAVMAARQAARRTERMNYLKGVGLGLHNFQGSYQHLPPAVRRDELGRPLCSWRLQIDPYLQARMLGIDFSDRWDDPANRYLTTRPHWIYCRYPHRDLPECLHTNVVAVTGPGTAFEEGRACRVDEIPADTILVVEVPCFDAHWAEPGDLDVDHVPESIADGPYGDGICVVFADGAVWYLSPDVPVADLKKLFTIEGAKRYVREHLLGPYGGPG